ncbi:STM3941 family protein [Anaerolentibacter hominis]|uniref:STM3941 family protein n=1 Tax=Anaerolentibacter hominis TaxID=3079009 RepID=UPI0031B89B0C
MEDIVIREQHSKVVKTIVMGFMMMAASVGILLVGLNEQVIIYTLIGILGAVFFGVCFVIWIIRAGRPKPLLIIKADGIVDSSSAVSAGFLPFDQIERFSIIASMGQKFIGVHMKDSAGYLEQLVSTRRKAAESNIKLGFPPVCIRMDTLDGWTLEEVYQILKERLEKRQ